MPRSIFITEPLDVLVVSFGGVGTTFLMKEIGRYLRTNDPDNKDGLKHLSLPPLRRGKPVKTIYVYGDPVMACLSLFRRQYHHTLSRVMQHFFPTNHVIGFEETLQDYLGQPREGLYFERHFRTWMNIPTGYPVFFLRYESIHDELAELAGYLELGPDFIAGFPPRKQRKSSWEDTPVELRQKLKQRYGALQAELTERPDSWVKPATKVRFPLSEPYRRAYYQSVRANFPGLVKLVQKFRS